MILSKLFKGNKKEVAIEENNIAEDNVVSDSVETQENEVHIEETGVSVIEEANLEDVVQEVQIEEVHIEEVAEVEEIREAEKIEEVQEVQEVEIETIQSEHDQEKVEQEKVEHEKTEKTGFFKKLLKGVEKTRANIFNSIDNVFSVFKSVDEELFEELEEALIISDIGVETSMYIIENLRKKAKKNNITEVNEIKDALIEEIVTILESEETELAFDEKTVLLIIGVNGVGKTTTIGKLINNFKSQDKTVMVAAADTFRAAAIEQLQVWCDRSSTNMIKHQEGSDPSAVVFDAINSAKSKNTDILVCDTAGRLHNKKHLMEELKKIHRTIETNYAEAKIETFLVLDSTTGQNALQQAKLFSEVADITGIVLTKLDGTAKGGVVVAIKHEMNIPIRYIGVGEAIDDLQVFDAKSLARAMFYSDNN